MGALSELSARYQHVVGPDRRTGRLLLRLRMWRGVLRLLLEGTEESRRIARLCLRLVPRFSMLPPRRLRVLYDMTRKLLRERVPGAIVECGSWNGGSSAMMVAAMAEERRFRDLWLFDSFRGLPPPTERDPRSAREGYRPGWCVGSPVLARSICRRMGIPKGKLHLVEGWFTDTFRRRPVGPIGLLHIDCDWYDSVRMCLETFYDALSAGAFVVIDDYHAFGGAKEATNDFLRSRGIAAAPTDIDSCAVYFRKSLVAASDVDDGRAWRDPESDVGIGRTGTQGSG